MSQTGKSGSQGKTAALTRLNRSLLIGSSILAVILVANVVAYVVPPERSKDEFRHEPSHVVWLQQWLWPNEVRNQVFHVLTQSGDTSADTVIFESRPRATGVLGKRYEYQPRSAQALTSFVLQGEVPEGVTVDSVTGVVSGIPVKEGKFDMVLAAALGLDRRVEQQFTLFIDERFLVLGADGLGRDILKRIAASSRYTIIPGLIAVLIGVGGGTLMGALGGFYAGTARRLMQGMAAIIQSVPGLLFVFLIGAISNYNIYVLMVVVGFIMLPETANGVYERVESFRKRDFVEAARELGMHDRTILWNEIVWHNARAFLLTRVTQSFVYAILIGVTLSYLGLTERQLPLIGGMLLEGRDAVIAETTTVLALASLLTLLLIIAGFSLTERGILRLWERRRR